MIYLHIKRSQSKKIDLFTTLSTTEAVMWKFAQQKTAPSLRAVLCEVLSND